jgi:uncharacterized damage-inducible protein DinB
MCAQKFMKVSRKKALLSLGALGLSWPTLAHQERSTFRDEFRTAWKSSEKYTLELYDQMPEKLMDWKYTPDSFSWRTQFVHCIIFNAGQLAARLGIEDPFDARTMKSGHWKSRKKKELAKDLREFYAWVQKVADEFPDERLMELTSFGSEDIPLWRLFYALENHIIHHRGQAVCYLRLNGITPIGYVGW